MNKNTPETPANAAETTQNTAVDPLFDADLLYAEDDEGQKIPDADIEAEATRIITVKWRAGGKNHVAEIRPGQLTYAQRRAPQLYAQQFALKHGLSDHTAEEIEADPEIAEQIQTVNAELETDEGFLLKRAEMACAAVVRDKHGRARVSVPHWRENLNPEVVTADNVSGRRFVGAVEAEAIAFFS